MMHAGRVGTGLARRAAMSLFALILLGAPRMQQAQALPTPHKRGPTDHPGATKCTPPALRDALSTRHVMPDVQGCAYQGVRGYFLEFGQHAAIPRAEASSLAAGTITHQVPVPGTPLAANEQVMLYVSSGAAAPPPVAMIMPRVKDRTEANALDVLHRVGLHNITFQPGSSTKAKGTVYQQTPDPGMEITANTPVRLGISRGPSTVVPEVIGQIAGAAEAAIRARRLRPVFKGTEDGTHPRGEVSRTMPPGDTTVDSGAEVGYWTASGFNEVPDLHLRTLKEAAILLRQAGFRLGPPAKRSTSDSYNVGRILDQQPMARTRAEVGVAIATSVGQAPAKPGNGTLSVVASALGGVLVLGGGWWLQHLLRIARTRRLLKLKPSRGLDEAVRFIVAPHFNAPTVTLRSRLEDGETRFRDGLPVLYVEIRDE